MYNCSFFVAIKCTYSHSAAIVYVAFWAIIIMYRCPDCGDSMITRVVVTRLGDIDGWNCKSCDSFYDRREIKKAILKP